MRSLIQLLTLTIFLFSCGQNTSNDKMEDKKESKTDMKFSEKEIAIFTISSVMNQPPSIISAKQKDNIYLVSYKRPSDGDFFEYKIKFEGNDKVIWGNSDGRWRDTEYDAQISFKEKGDQLIITQVFSDGSTEDKEYQKNDLEKVKSAD